MKTVTIVIKAKEEDSNIIRALNAIIEQINNDYVEGEAKNEKLSFNFKIEGSYIERER